MFLKYSILLIVPNISDTNSEITEFLLKTKLI